MCSVVCEERREEEEERGLIILKAKTPNETKSTSQTKTVQKQLQCQSCLTP